MRKLRILSLALVVVLLMSLLPTTLAEGEIVRGGTLVIGKSQKVTTLNPTRCNGKGLDDDVYVMVYEPLIHTDESGTLVPGLATAWELHSIYQLRLFFVSHHSL